MSKNNGSGCGMLLVGAVVIGLLLWGVAVLLWVLAFAVPVVATGFGVTVLLQARDAKRKAREVEAVDAELTALTRDASLDLAETITRWDNLILTKGIGTPLEGREDEAAEIHRRLITAHEFIRAAATPAHRIQAVLHADSLRSTAQSFLQEPL